MINKKGFMNNMKGNKFGAVVLAAIFTISMFMASCYLPNPLYGTWVDNAGNSVQFSDDGTFSATIKDSDNNDLFYEGNWNTVDNVLIFNLKGGRTIDAEWDLRGALLYLTYTINGRVYLLTLYHTKR